MARGRALADEMSPATVVPAVCGRELPVYHCARVFGQIRVVAANMGRNPRQWVELPEAVVDGRDLAVGLLLAELVVAATAAHQVHVVGVADGPLLAADPHGVGIAIRRVYPHALLEGRPSGFLRGAIAAPQMETVGAAGVGASTPRIRRLIAAVAPGHGGCPERGALPAARRRRSGAAAPGRGGATLRHLIREGRHSAALLIDVVLHKDPGVAQPVHALDLGGGFPGSLDCRGSEHEERRDDPDRRENLDQGHALATAVRASLALCRFHGVPFVLAKTPHTVSVGFFHLPLEDWHIHRGGQ